MTTRDIEIRNAVPQGAVPYYQPIVSIGSPQEVGYEVLGRLQVQGQILAPGQFLPSLERSPFLAQFDQAILARAIEQQGSWIHRDDRDVHLHVNASKQALVQPGYSELVDELLRAHRVCPEYLTIEVVETCTFWRSPATLRTLASLRQMGVKVAVDDFPCWKDPQSLLDWLSANRGVVQTLKLDRSLVVAACGHDLKGNPLEEGVSQKKLDELISYVNFAHQLGLTVVAEGVETSSQELTLQLCGVDALQGYYFGRPAPVESVKHLDQLRSDYGPPLPAIAQAVANQRP